MVRRHVRSTINPAATITATLRDLAIGGKRERSQGSEVTNRSVGLIGQRGIPGRGVFVGTDNGRKMATTVVRADPLRCLSLVSIASVAFNNNTTPPPEGYRGVFSLLSGVSNRAGAREMLLASSLIPCSLIIRAIGNSRDSPGESSSREASRGPILASLLRDAPVSASRCRLRASMSLKRTPPDCISRSVASAPETRHLRYAVSSRASDEILRRREIPGERTRYPQTMEFRCGGWRDSVSALGKNLLPRRFYSFKSRCSALRVRFRDARSDSEASRGAF